METIFRRGGGGLAASTPMVDKKILKRQEQPYYHGDFLVCRRGPLQWKHHPNGNKYMSNSRGFSLRMCIRIEFEFISQASFSRHCIRICYEMNSCNMCI